MQGHDSQAAFLEARLGPPPALVPRRAWPGVVPLGEWLDIQSTQSEPQHSGRLGQQEPGRASPEANDGLCQPKPRIALATAALVRADPGSLFSASENRYGHYRRAG